MYAKLDAENVSRLQSIGEIEAFINKLSKRGADTRFEEIVGEIKKKENGDRKRAERVLSWLSCTFRHLTIDELQDAVTMESGVKASLDKSKQAVLEGIVDVCDGLVVIDPIREKVHLFHDSVYDYFRRCPIIETADAHKRIAITCLKYIRTVHKGHYSVNGGLENKIAEFPLLRYAVQYWGDHTRKIGDSIPDRLVKRFAKYLHDKELLEFLVRAGATAREHYPDYARYSTEGMTSIHLAASSGLNRIVECLIDQGIDIDEVDANGRTALHIAAEGGYLGVVKLLLRKLPSALYNRDLHGRTPLHLAASNGHQRVVRYLVTNSSGRDTNPDARDLRGQTALHLAVLNGHEKIMNCLLKNGANPNATDAHGQTAFHLLALNGHQAVARALMSNPHTAVDVGITDIDHRTALHIAAWRGNREIAELLLREPVDAKDAKDKHGLTSLHYAASQGHRGVVKMLLEKGADIHAQDNSGWTALHSACLKRHNIAKPSAIDQLPVAYPAQLPRSEEQPESSILLAKGSILSLNTLRQQDGHNTHQKTESAKLMPTDPGGVICYPNTQELQFTGARLFEIQDELISRRCNLKCKHEEVVKLLLTSGSTIDSKCQATLYLPFCGYATANCTPLHLAIFSDHEAVVQALVEGGCNTQDDCYFDSGSQSSATLTTLDLATMLSSKSIVELLLQRETFSRQPDVNFSWNVEINHRDYSSRMPIVAVNATGTAFHLAVATNVARLLQTRGLDPNLPLSLAAIVSTRIGNIQMFIELKRKNDEASIDWECNISVHYHDPPVALGHGNIPLKVTALRIEALPSLGFTLNAECLIGDTLLKTLWESFFSFAITQESMATLWKLLGVETGTDAKPGAAMYKADGGTPICMYTKMTALDFAAMVGDVGAVSLLYDRTYNANTPVIGEFCHHVGKHLEICVRVECKAIHLAALSGSVEVVRLLLEKQPLANQKGMVDIEIKQQPSEKSSFVNLSFRVEEVTAMHLAICFGAGDLLWALVAKKADLDALASTKVNCKYRGEVDADIVLKGYQTPLQFAILLKKAELVGSLLEKGAFIGGMIEFEISCELHEPSRALKANGTAMALHIAVFQGSIAIVEVLLNHGADVNTTCPSTICVENRINPAFPINTRIDRGLTALHLAALLGNDELVRLLLKKGADIEAKSANQMTALDVARAMGNESTIHLFDPDATETRPLGSVRDLPSTSALEEKEGDTTEPEAAEQKLPNKQPNELEEREAAEVRHQEDDAWRRRYELNKDSPLRGYREGRNTKGHTPGGQSQPRRRDIRRDDHRSRRSVTRNANRPTSHTRNQAQEQRGFLSNTFDRLKRTFWA